jgi:type II secretory pathway component PulF
MSARSISTAKAALFQQLATAVRRDVPLTEVVSVLVDDDEWTRRSRAALRRLNRSLEVGDPLSAALAAEPGLFAPRTAELVRVTEPLGSEPLAAVLEALAADARRENDASRDWEAAMNWPLALGAMLMVVLAVWSIQVRPAMREAFEAMRAPLPLFFDVSGALAAWWMWVPLVYALLLFWRAGWLPRFLLEFMDNASSLIWFVDRWRRTRFTCRLLDWLPLCAAWPALRRPIVAHLAATTRAAWARSAAHRLDAAFESGATLGDALAQLRALPPRLAVLTKLGERLRTLPQVLEDLRRDAQQSEALAFMRFERGSVLLCYIVIGSLVGVLLVSIYLPIFKIGTLL